MIRPKGGHRFTILSLKLINEYSKYQLIYITDELGKYKNLGRYVVTYSKLENYKHCPLNIQFVPVYFFF